MRIHIYRGGEMRVRRWRNSAPVRSGRPILPDEMRARYARALAVMSGADQIVGPRAVSTVAVSY